MLLEPKLMARQRGVTMLELMIVVVIVSILAAVAYPSYMQYVVSTKRTAATATLMQIAERQQQFFMDNKSFTNDLTNLGYAANPLSINDSRNSVAAGDGDSVYTITLSNITATTYTATASPLHGQLSRDMDCGSLTLNQAAVQGNSAGGDDCW